MTVIMMEPLVIRGRAPTRASPTTPEAEPPLGRARAPLTNRAAGTLRDAPERVRFGGFAYARTAEDDAQVATAVARALRPGTAEAATGPGTGADPGGAPALPDAPSADIAEPAAVAETEEAPTDAAGAAGSLTAVAPTTGPGGVTAPAPAPGSSPAAPPSSASEVSTAGLGTPAALVSAARAAADGLPHPEVPRAPLGAALAPMTATAGTRAARPLARGGGGGRYPPPRPAQPIEIDPVPTATEALSTALNARLPELSLPAPRAMPDGTVPAPAPVRGVTADELAVEVNVDDPAADAASVNATEATRRRDASRTPTEPPAAPPAPVPISPPVLVDFRRAPPPPLPQADADLETGQLARVLALITADLPRRVDELVQHIRDESFPEKKLANYYLDLTDPWKPTITTGLNTVLDELRQAAGVTVEVLDAAVSARRAELEAGVTHVATAAELEVDRAAQVLTREAERENARIEADRRRDTARQVARYRRALHSRDPALVEELARARIGYIDADVGRGTAAIDAAKARRLELLTDYDAAYREAYRRADDAFQHPAGRGPRAPPNEGNRLWFDVACDALTTAMTGLRTQTQTDAASLYTSVQDAGIAAKAAVRTWSDTRLRRELTADERVRRSTADLDATNTAITAARAEAARNTTRDRLVGEIRFASAAYLHTLDVTDEVSREHAINLTEEQAAQGRRFLASGDAGDPLSAVANVQVQRYQTEHLATKPAELRDAVLAKVPADVTEAGELGDIYFPDGGGALEARVNRLWNAFETWTGTDVDEAISALGELDSHSTALLNRTYFLIKGQSLRWRIRDEMSGSDRDRALGLARGDAEGRRMHARGVIAESNGWFSDDPAAALAAIRNLPPGEARAVVDDPDTRAHLTSVLGGARWVDGRGSITDTRGEDELQLLVQLNRPLDATDPAEAARRRDLQARADAIEFDRAVRRGTGEGASTDAVLSRLRQRVVASAPATWSDSEIDSEVRRRVRAMENAYETEFGSELPSGGVSALRTAVARYSTDTTLDLRQALLDVNRDRERAVRLQRTTEGFYAADSDVNAELTRTYTDALAEVRRSAARRDAVETRAQALMAGDGLTGPQPSRVLNAYRREAEEEAARTLSSEWMSGASRAFADRYGSRWGGGDDPLREMVTSATQFGGETEALARLNTGGGLTAARAVELGQAGWGMDRTMVLGALDGRTTQQLARISSAYSANTDGGDMLADLRSETGGWTDVTADRSLERDAFDIREALRGVPTTPREEYGAAQRRFAYERDVYFGGRSDRPAAVGGEFASLQRQMDRANARMREWEAATASGDTDSARRLEAALASARDSVGVSADAYRHAVDAHVEGVAQKVAIGVALAVVAIVAVATSILTAGAAAPAWVAVAAAVAASLAGTAASMAVKSSMLGSAYGQNAFRTDLVVGAVDAIVAALTAGLGDKLLRLPRLTGTTAAARTLMARSIAAQRAARPLLARAGAFTAEQVAQSVPTALTGAALSRDTWRGDPLRNFAAAGGLAAITGIGMGGVMHHAMPRVTGALGGLVDAARVLRSGSGAHISADSITFGSTRQAATTGNVEGTSNRGTFMERWAARREFQRLNPEATEADFLLALAQGSMDAEARASAVASSLPELRAHLLSGLSGADADLAAHARIEVLSDAEFFARTGSRSNGYAATLNVGGEPVVVVREGAPPSRLAEEGRHIAQFFDPANSPRLALLDERGFTDYASWSLADQIAAWQAKIDLELDVQARTIPELRSRLGGGELSGEHALDLSRMLAEAEAALGVLSARRADLGALSPADLARMTAGDLPPPRFLADEPRLFAKHKASPPETWTSGSRTFVAEASFRDGGRKSRYVTIYEGGEVVEVVLERHDSGAWRLSGRVGRDRGGIAEYAARLEHERAALAQESSTVSLRQLSGQTGTGAGLDDLWFRFELKTGVLECRAHVYEAKNYDGLVSSFSAVNENYRTNINRARDRLQTHLTRGTWADAGMTREQVEAALAALKNNQVDIIIRTTASTTVNPAHLSTIQRRLRRGRKGATITVDHDTTPISEAALLDAEELWLRTEAFRRLGYKDPDNILFKDLANGPRGLTTESIDVAEAVVTARGQPGSLLAGKIAWAPGRTHLTDRSGPFRVRLETRPPNGTAFDASARAGAILDAVTAGVPGAGGSSVAPVRVVVDYSSLTPAQFRELRSTLAALAASRGRTSAAALVMWTPPLISRP